MRNVAIDKHNQAELRLRTADRRDWRVLIDLTTLGLLAERRILSEDDAYGTINRHISMLNMAAFRVIARGVEGDVVRLTASDLRLPPRAVAA